MTPMKLLLALAALGAAVPATAQSTMANTQATTNPSMTNQSMHKTQVVRHTTTTTRRTTHATAHKKALVSCRRMSHARMMKTPRCHSMRHSKNAMGHTHKTMTATIHTDVKKPN